MSAQAPKRWGRGRPSDVMDRIVSLPLIGGIRLLRRMRYDRRVAFGGWLVSRLMGPALGYRRRVMANLNLVFPDMPMAEKRQLCTRALDSMGRSLTELFSPGDLAKVARNAQISGPGRAALQEAHEHGRPVVLVSGHFGNYDVWRYALVQQGFEVGALYREMNFTRFNTFYVENIGAIGAPLFPRGRRGLGEMLRHLRAGKQVGILIDQHMGAGAVIQFLGHPAATALSAAEMALKNDALFIPVYAVRRPDGLSFDILVEDPVAPSDALQMTEAATRSLEAQIMAHPEQWLWTHRRWKTGRSRKPVTDAV